MMEQELLTRIPPKPSKIKFYLTIILVFGIILSSALFSGFSIMDIIRNLKYAFRLIDSMFFPPRWDYADNVIKPLLETVQMAILGSFFGAILAFPAALLAASNFIKIKWVNNVTRIMLNFFRTIPALVLAALFVAVFGLGSFSGIVALTIFSFGLISKMTYESIEAIDYGQVEAVISLGGNRLNVFRYAILPQVLPQYISYTLYAFEVNVRAAAVLGYVGAGGIGQYYEIFLNMRRFDFVGIIVLISFLAVLIIDFVSSSIRRRLV
ncbi:MAG: phosphonate ABC transporter, permease protein PhnE [Candidatus Izemoplasmatales bacterium]|nr:phosphonate ABC transporter, permease protein PhnE [Candidatus Izemoplasmatales bacterium]